MLEAKSINGAIERYFGKYDIAYSKALERLPVDVRPTQKQMQNAPQKWFPDVIIHKLADYFVTYDEWLGVTYNRLRKMKEYMLSSQHETFLESHRLNEVIEKNFESFAEAYNKAIELLPESVRPEPSRTSRSLPLGVCLTPNGKYRTGIRQNKKNIDLGTHDTSQKAAMIYQEALKLKQSGQKINNILPRAIF